ncbi:acetyl-CoA hydrolase/transferase C-terminal domain-containing protein [Haloarculaceae archaeon H-GB11]|nr:acetyl-CoA hydrolase/transferase C-terminal domain-containing protein [Haloarculaceae archaeon H-GB11]
MRDAANAGTVHYQDRHVSQVSDDVQYGGLADVETAIVEAVAVGEDWLVPSTSIGHTPALVADAEQVVVEVNRAQPLELQRVHDVYRPGKPPTREPIPLREPSGRMGSPRVEFDADKLAAVVETERPDTPYQFRAPTDTDRTIAVNLARFLESEIDRNPVFESALNLQFGVGSLGNALMSAISEVPVGDRTVSYWGEVIQDGLLDMLDEDVLAAASATSLAFSEDGQERFFADIDDYADDLVVRPADVSNNPTLVDRFGVVAVNSALEVDVYGHVNSTHLNGSRVINGIGGSGDFNRAASVTIVALPSTAKDGEISRVVPMVPHVDHTEHEIDVVITEQGVADVRGTSPRERAETIVEQCAHPDHRPTLSEYLDDAAEETGGHEPHRLDRVFSWTD